MVTIPNILLKRHCPLHMSCSRWFSYKIFFILSFVVVLIHISINNDYIFVVANATTIPTTSSTIEQTELIDSISDIDIDSSIIPIDDDDDANDDMNDSIENEETEFDEEGDENDEVEDEYDDTSTLFQSETNVLNKNLDDSIMNDLIDENEIIQNDILSDTVYTTTNEKYDDDSKTSNNTNINCESDGSTSCNDTISENVVDPNMSNIATPTTTKSLHQQQHQNTVPLNATNTNNFSSLGTNQEVDHTLEDDDRSLLDIFGEVTKVYLTQQVIPPTDIDCRWDWRTIQCESSCHCSLQWKLGDYHLGRACRRRRRRQQQSSVQDGQQQEEEEIDDTNVCVPTIYIIDQPIPKRFLSLVHQTFDILRHKVHRLIQRMVQKIQYEYQTIQNYVCADLLSHLYVTIDGNQCWVLYPSSTTIFEKIFCRQYLYNTDISLCRQQTVATGSTTSS